MNCEKTTAWNFDSADLTSIKWSMTALILVLAAKSLFSSQFCTLLALPADDEAWLDDRARGPVDEASELEMQCALASLSSCFAAGSTHLVDSDLALKRGTRELDGFLTASSLLSSESERLITSGLPDDGPASCLTARKRLS